MTIPIAPAAHTTWAVVPVKRLTESKSRLAPVLSAPARAALQRAMFGDVLAALRRSANLAGIIVVTEDPAIAGMARGSGAVVVDEPVGRGNLNAAIGDGVIAARQRGAVRALVVPADIPLIETSDVDEVVALGERSASTLVVPSHDLAGTNGLSIFVDDPPAFAFGTESFVRHLNMGGPRAATRCRLGSFEKDVDTPSDLAAMTVALRERASRGVVSLTAAWALADHPCDEDCQV